MVKKQRWLYILMVLFISCADYELLNLGEPESVQLQISAVTDSTVSLVWSKSHDEDFKNYKLYYSRKETVDNNDSLVDSLSFRVDTVRTVRGLAPDTRYYFRVLVTTGRNLSSPSNEVDTITCKDTVIDTLNHLKLFAPEIKTDSTVMLRWSKYTDFFDSYKVFGDTTWEVNTKDPLYAIVYQDTTLIISKLIKNKKYWFRVYTKKYTSYLAESNSIEVLVP